MERSIRNKSAVTINVTQIGVSIDELTAKAKLEMVKVGKSGKVFGNRD